MSKKSDAIEYFKANPNAVPKEVAAMFGISMTNIYQYRKAALSAPKKVSKIKTIGSLKQEDFSAADQAKWVQIALDASNGRGELASLSN